MSQRLRKGATMLGTAYLVSCMIAAPYFNWKYAREHGFVSWVFFGEVIATFNAAIWPYYLFASSTSNRPQTLESFRVSIAAIQEAFSLGPDTSSLTAKIPKEEFDKIVSLHRLALEHAKKVNPEELKAWHREMPQRFLNDYVGGLQMFCEGADAQDLGKMNQGTLLINQWGRWYQSQQQSR